MANDLTSLSTEAKPLQRLTGLSVDLQKVLDWSQSSEALRISESLKKALAPSEDVKKALEQLNRLRIDPRQFASPLDSLVKEAAKFQNAANQWCTGLAELNAQYKTLREGTWRTELLLGFQEIGAQVQKALSSDIARHAAEALKQFNFPKIDWEAYREREGVALAFAASHGWFIQAESDAGFSRYVEKCKDNPELLDELFTHILERDIKAIEARLVGAFPDRSRFLEEAFRLHREERYIASVPVLLLCSDGISKSLTGKSPFTGKSGPGPQIVDWVRKQDLDSWSSTFFDVLCKHHPLSKVSVGRMNRHKVMHGEDLAYPTRMNSLRAVSFLGFVGWLLDPNSEFVKRVQEAE